MKINCHFRKIKINFCKVIFRNEKSYLFVSCTLIIIITQQRNLIEITFHFIFIFQSVFFLFCCVYMSTMYELNTFFNLHVITYLLNMKFIFFKSLLIIYFFFQRRRFYSKLICQNHISFSLSQKTQTLLTKNNLPQRYRVIHYKEKIKLNMI